MSNIRFNLVLTVRCFVKIFTFVVINRIPFKFAMIQSLTHLQTDDLKLGLFLCTSGFCKLKINDTEVCIERNYAFIKSPILHLEVVHCSEDFSFRVITRDEVSTYAPVSQHMGILENVLLRQRFWVILTNEESEHLQYLSEQIERKQVLLKESHIGDGECALLKHIVKNMQQMAIMEYAYLLSKSMSEIPPKEEQDGGMMLRFALLLINNYRVERQVSFYANKLCVCPNHFARIIKGISGRTPSEWIAIVTINQAKALLARPELQVKEVANMLSFPEQFTFRKYFKHHTGLSPREYRKSIAIGAAP